MADSPSGSQDSPIARLVAERGATMPKVNLLDLDWPDGPPTGSPPIQQILDEQREDRL